MSDAQLRPEFISAITKLRDKIYKKVGPDSCLKLRKGENAHKVMNYHKFSVVCVVWRSGCFWGAWAD